MKPRVLILGAGFGGIAAARQLAGKSVDVTIIDRQNHHLFQPLLYQVATSGLSAPEICQPVRSIFRNARNVHVRMDSVRAIDPLARTVELAETTLAYDYLIVALGAGTAYFGHPEWEAFAPGLKTIEDALAIRSRVLLAFEQAEQSTDAMLRNRLMTVVIVGAGPTGVELAGAFSELARHVLRRDFRNIDSAAARIVLVEAADRVLPQLPPDLGARALQELKDLGVEVRLSCKVESIDADGAILAGGERIAAANMVWAAGIRASTLGSSLPAGRDRAGRVCVGNDLSLSDHRNVFVIGDMAAVNDPSGRPVPGVAPAAMQMGAFVGKLIAREAGSTSVPDRPSFRYLDKGTMATIGRSAAVAQIGGLHFGGFPAWLAWLLIHLLFLVGFRNRLAVLLQWMYGYLIYRRGARVILPTVRPSPSVPHP